ncbi:MAG: condensation domain-containing protein, partial [Burkholderiales bacterium]
MNDFSQRIANLSPEKRTLLEAHLKRKKNIAERAIPHLPRSGQTQSFPVSFAEQRLWFLDQWQPNSPLYNIGIAYTFEGALNVGLFERCLKEIVKRHESLRTSFSSQDGEPVQVIHPNVDLSLAFTDLCALPEDQREGEARKLAVQEAQAGFDLTKAPLLRVRLLRLAAEKHVLLTAIHHIVSDGWSIGIFFKELSELYSAYSRGMPTSLAELAIQYADYAVWQRQWLQDKELDKQRTYWKRQLAAGPALLELPTDRPRPALQSFKGARQTRMMRKRLGDGLKTLSQREGATLFMTLLAAFQILLSRYSRSSDVLVGSPIAGRMRAETEDLIGFFVNTLVLRTDLSGNPSFRELLSRVREVALAAYAHQDLPFEKLVEELNPERSLSHSPLFQAMFVLQNTGPRELHLPGITVSRLEFERTSTKFDLSLYAFETGEGLRLHV